MKVKFENSETGCARKQAEEHGRQRAIDDEKVKPGKAFHRQLDDPARQVAEEHQAEEREYEIEDLEHVRYDNIAKMRWFGILRGSGCKSHKAALLPGTTISTVQVICRTSGVGNGRS